MRSILVLLLLSCPVLADWRDFGGPFKVQRGKIKDLSAVAGVREEVSVPEKPVTVQQPVYSYQYPTYGYGYSPYGYGYSPYGYGYNQGVTWSFPASGAASCGPGG